MTKTKLFSELRLRDVVLKNRIVASPMWQYKGLDGHPTDWHLMNLGRLADGGSGLVFQEGTTVSRSGRGTVGDLGIWDDEMIPEYARITALVRANGAVPGIQLMHAGRKGRVMSASDGGGSITADHGIAGWDEWDVVAPSAVAHAGLPVPRALSRSEILSLVDEWIAAARRADAAGYDVLDIHGAHGYLIHQFLSEASNIRTDDYGGSPENRARFLVEIIEGVRSAWPASKPLLLRLSVVDGAGWEIEDSIKLVSRLAPLGVDLIDCSAGGMVGPSLAASIYGYQVHLAEAIRRATRMATSAVGLIVHAQQAEDILQRGRADLVFLARELMYNPNWPIDAAQKLGDEKGFSVANHRTGYFLGRRATVMPDLCSSTFYRATEV
ncbi:NADH:flavin oxidoreductase/NADH oxidase [Sphingosinicella microcystinivorans]|uniref:NADH:flavin oxidoreductase/NADH oxidase n=1 Tax=Sphingosinicella microcystinivorans TaxID=335406 RepID=UPI0022F3D757|nr:NADH:flavin oxidoreductase/NADH oxidase [Sphingosinicella microcystinivorans]WBX83773.1 NADH:flavin oxidoreductase/NADH oxidase [Sphingosinicella microcystinivorans]